MAYNVIAEKSGAGAFMVARNSDGDICVRIGDGSIQRFATPQAAYDAMRDRHERTSDHAAWNAAYHLEGLLAAQPLAE